jgi:hypothetical protein
LPNFILTIIQWLSTLLTIWLWDLALQKVPLPFLSQATDWEKVYLQAWDIGPNDSGVLI